jgi:subtilase family serine protease
VVTLDSTFQPLKKKGGGGDTNNPGGPVAYTPTQIRLAYGINQTSATGAGQTIAIVDAYHDPNITSDAATFNTKYGLQQFGGTGPSLTVHPMASGIKTDSGWAGETSLDVEWAHAVAPGANILLVEAPSATYSSLLSAVSYAASQPGVVAVSMSWGGSEFASESAYDTTFTTPSGHIGGSGKPGGVTFTASSGDNGAWFGPLYPSVSPNVLAVGGTSLYLNSNGTYRSESGWSGSGGGFSSYESEPPYQKGVQNSGARTTPDVSYNANPNTGFMIYDTVPYQGHSGFFPVGGTSAGAPQWAGIMALTDEVRAANGKGSLGNAQSAVYNLPSSDFHDVTSGSNGYSATPGYDLVTGLGSPIVNKVVADLAAQP